LYFFNIFLQQRCKGLIVLVYFSLLLSLHRYCCISLLVPAKCKLSLNVYTQLKFYSLMVNGMMSDVNNGLFWRKRSQKSFRKVEICEVLSGRNLYYVFSPSRYQGWIWCDCENWYLCV